MKTLLESILSQQDLEKNIDSDALEKMSSFDYEKIIFQELGVLWNLDSDRSAKITVIDNGRRTMCHYAGVSKAYKNYHLVDIGPGLYWVCYKSKRSDTTFQVLCTIGHERNRGWGKGYPHYQVDPYKIKEFLDKYKP